MREVQFADAAEHFADIVSEAEAGECLTILRGDRPVAKIVPFRLPIQDAADELERRERREREHRRAAAFERISAIMERGLDLGGEWNGRSELYQRD